MGIAMMGVMHFYFHFTQPLFVQSLMGIKNIYDAKPVAIHILGKPAVGDLKRPFKAAGMFGAGAFRPRHRFLFSLPYSLSFVALAAGPKTDAAAIAEAEKKIGKKEE
jgi:hypothetical protein